MPLNDFLIRYVLELCEQGMVVMTLIISRRASGLCQIFLAKPDGAKSLIVYRQLKTHGLRYQMGTHESQCFPAEAASDGLDFMKEIKRKISESNFEKNTLSIWIKPLSSSLTPNKL